VTLEAREHWQLQRRPPQKGGTQYKTSEGFKLRSGCIAMRGSGADVEVLLISSGTYDGRWVLPAGTLEEDEEFRSSAARELEEEAGILATIGACLGVLPDRSKSSHTVWYAARVTQELTAGDDGWQAEQTKAGLRKRQWFPASEAAQLVGWKEFLGPLVLLAAKPRPRLFLGVAEGNDSPSSSVCRLLALHCEVQNDVSSSEDPQGSPEALRAADAVVIEVSTPSLAAGYQLAVAEASKLPVLVLCDAQAMPLPEVFMRHMECVPQAYSGERNACDLVDSFLSGLQ